MSTRHALARLGAPAAALAAITLIASPANAHVSATPSVANAGAYTVVTMGVPHGCDGSPTTKVEIQIPESVLSVTPTRHPLYEVETTIAKLDEPVEDAHGNEVSERIGSVVYTAKTPLPEGQRDAFELSFQIPDVAGETLAFPTIQTCEQGRLRWVEVPQEGQDPHELEYPAPAFEVLPAEGDGHDGAAAEDGHGEDETGTGETEQAAVAGADTVSWAALAAGLIGLSAGVTALLRSRQRA